MVSNRTNRDWMRDKIIAHHKQQKLSDFWLIRLNYPEKMVRLRLPLFQISDELSSLLHTGLFYVI